MHIEFIYKPRIRAFYLYLIIFPRYNTLTWRNNINFAESDISKNSYTADANKQCFL
ncbi:hypothetical protein LTSEURB_6781 [Salmonella enterica subsp. enterica serovar Urbana str. R8-2977]|uniref:Uncharacterized protein n=1 Tax=Salmonella enterica subsp. enterica serovar Urbana str. R8-2977 TaxID=913084 RepID=G5S5H3_SALET|nr:hypothetical protein LTSEURB_6781 [Salmonella enterica subsp. enterica serovar Urbana str. R8-2977]